MKTISRAITLITVVAAPGFCFDHHPSVDIIRVPEDYTSIQAGIDAAVDGDVVLIADGTYKGDGNRDIDFLGKAITVTSENGPDVTIINCESDGRGFYFASGEGSDSILDGLTIKRGSGFNYGGGIYCRFSSPTIINCTISYNKATGYTSYGGGIGCYGGSSSPTIMNCTISKNEAIDYYGYGGGIYCRFSFPTITNCTISKNVAGYFGGGIYCSDTSPTITNCTISENEAIRYVYYDESGYGGGIYCTDSSPIITDCTISRNTADLDGGGIYCYSDPYYSSPTITNCIITGNMTSDSFSYGGGIYCSGFTKPTITKCIIMGNITWKGGGIYCSDPTEPTIMNCTISENITDGLGGGIYCNETSPTITNCTISKNEVTAYGGGIVCSSSSFPDITNCTIAENTALDQGGGIYSRYGSAAFITNGILWNNTPNEIYGNNPTITYSDIKGGWSGTGNIDENPRFVPVSVHGFEYILQPDSPCIDAGDPSIEDALYDWHWRWPEWYPDGARSDMGAYGGPGNVGWIWWQ